MVKFVRLLPLAAALLLVGCPFVEYQIEMTPQPDGTMVRRFGAVGVDGSNRAPLELSTTVATMYHSTTTSYPVSAKFAGRTPEDVGGWGFFHKYTTSLGSEWVYVETFRGDDAQGQRLEEAFGAVDQMAEMFSGYLREKYPNADGRKLAEFVQGDFRKDAKNVLVYGWMLASAKSIQSGSDQLDKEPIARGAAYLVRHGYVSPEDLPQLIKGANENIAALRKGIAAKAGVPESMLEELVPPSEKTIAAFGEYLTKKFARPASTQPYDENSAFALAGNRILALLALSYGTADKVTLNLNSSADLTNGKTTTTGKTGWTLALPAEASLPAVCYALWTQADEAVQKRLLGKVMLTGEPLAQYVLEVHQLSPEQAKLWEQSLLTLTPATAQEKLTKLWKSEDPKHEPFKKLTAHLLPPEVTSAPASQP